MAHLWTDPQIIQAVRAGGRQREDAWRFVTAHWGSYCIRVAMKITGCAKEVAVEAFSIAVAGVDKRIRSADVHDFLKQAVLKSYLAQSTINAAKAILRSAKHLTEANREDIQAVDETDWFDRENCRKIMEAALTHTGERCKKILMLFNDDYNMEEIAEEMGFANEDVAKKEKYGCQKKFKAFLEDNPHIRNLLKDNCYGR